MYAKAVAVPCMVVRTVLPHPGPLPLGEGESLAVGFEIGNHFDSSGLWLLRHGSRVRSPHQIKLTETGEAHAGGDFAHLAVGDFAGGAEGLIGGGDDHVLEELGVRGVQRLGINFDGGDGAVAFGNDFDGAAAAGGFDGASGELGLHLFHLLLHALGLLHHFSDAGHNLNNFEFWILNFEKIRRGPRRFGL